VADPLLVVFAGAPGTGKSTLARFVARETRAVYLSKETIKDTVLAVGRDVKPEGITDYAVALSYALLMPLARDNLTLGLSVVIDSPAGYRTFQEAIEGLVRSVKVDFRLIECITTDEALLRERLERRAAGPPDQRSRDQDVYQQARARLERLSGPRLVVDTAEPLQTNLRKITNYLNAGAAGGSDMEKS